MRKLIILSLIFFSACIAGAFEVEIQKPDNVKVFVADMPGVPIEAGKTVNIDSDKIIIIKAVNPGDIVIDGRVDLRDAIEILKILSNGQNT